MRGTLRMAPRARALYQMRVEARAMHKRKSAPLKILQTEASEALESRIHKYRIGVAKFLTGNLDDQDAIASLQNRGFQKPQPLFGPLALGGVCKKHRQTLS